MVEFFDAANQDPLSTFEEDQPQNHILSDRDHIFTQMLEF
jgi:hypothetical protein